MVRVETERTREAVPRRLVDGDLSYLSSCLGQTALCSITNETTQGHPSLVHHTRQTMGLCLMYSVNTLMCLCCVTLIASC